MEYQYTSTLATKLANQIEAQHMEIEDCHAVPCAYTPFHFLAKQGDSVLGVASGYTCYAEVYIDDLLVFAPHRKKGIGKALLHQVEVHFSTGQFHNINLVTNGFQTPAFYQKCGFTLEFIRKNPKNPKLDKYFYVKIFSTYEHP